MKRTPCGVLYHALSTASESRNYEDIDSRIISRTFSDSKGRTPYERIAGAGSFRTREIIQKDPRQLDVRLFREAHESCPVVVSYLKRDKLSNRQIVDFISGDATDEMCAALRDWGYEYHVFRNCMYDITRNNDPDDLNTAMAVTMLFMVTAFHGDPKESLPAFFEGLQRQAISVAMETGMLVDDVTNQAVESYPLLGMMRRYPSGEMGTTVYRLNPGAEGTLVGRTGVATFAVNDVGATASRRHLLIFRQDSVWYARGLGSKNGTTLERPDGTRQVIELPAAKRSPESESRNVAIHPDDILVLGYDTEFVLMRINAQGGPHGPAPDDTL